MFTLVEFIMNFHLVEPIALDQVYLLETAGAIGLIDGTHNKNIFR